MKKYFLSAGGFLLSICGVAQTTFVSDIESVTLTSLHNTVYNDSTGGGGFHSGHALFPSLWDTAFGGYWAAGWAASSVHDSATAGPGNLYGCAAYKGYANSNKFAVGTTSGKLTLKLTDSLIGKTVTGFYVCNSTYAYKSMKYGDAFAKKFGDTTGTHCGCSIYPDWFKLTVKRYYRDTLRSDSVEVYLADFRFANSSQDYILNNWTWVNLVPLGLTDSLAFYLHSTDNGMYGMNTPAFFCIDNLTLSTITGIADAGNGFESPMLFPNPADQNLNIDFGVESGKNAELQVKDIMGRTVYSNHIQLQYGMNHYHLDLSGWEAGTYFAELVGDQGRWVHKFMKQ